MLIQDKMHNGICCPRLPFLLRREPIDALPGKESATGAQFIWGSPSVGSCLDARAPSGPPTGMAASTPNVVAARARRLNVDACGTVYVTEFVQGLVALRSGATAAVIAASLPSQWIPNMHWGVRCWDPMTLYVSDRDQGRIFAAARPSGKHTTIVW
jgi:hypothetical protein